MGLLRQSKELLALQEITKTFTPPAGKKVRINYFNIAGDGISAKLVWKHGTPDEEIIWVIGDKPNPMIDIFDIPAEEVDGSLKIAVIMKNTLSVENPAVLVLRHAIEDV